MPNKIEAPPTGGASILYVVDIDVAVGDGVDGEGRNTLHAQFVHDVLAMRNDRR